MSEYTIRDGLASIESEELFGSWWERPDYLEDITEALGSAGLADKRLVMAFEIGLARLTSARTMGAELDALLEQYLVEDYRQYGNSIPRGRAGLAHWFRTVAIHFPGSPPPPVAVMAQAGLVTVVLHLKTAADSPGGATARYIITVFRVQDGKIVEHWGGGAP